jgi:cell wall-associated NlpC family hydrolase
MPGTNMAAAARSLVGVPFLHRGRSRRGLDCAGVVWLARKMTFGLSDDDRSYPPRPTSQMVLEGMERRAERVSLRDVRAGDVVVMKFASFATHLGVLTETGVIHAIPGAGVIESDRGEFAKKRSFLAAFRLSRSTWQS